MNDEMLHAYFDGELSATEAAEVERALGADPELARRLAQLRAIDAALSSLPGAETDLGFTGRVLEAAQVDGALDHLAGAEASDGFTERVVAAARRERRRGLVLRLAVPFAAAAAILVALWINPFDQTKQNGTKAQEVGYAWESDLDTFGSLALPDLEDEILKELEAT